MDIALRAGSLLEVESPLLVVNLFEGVSEPAGATAAVDQALGGLVRRLIDQREVRGELGQVVVIHNPGAGDGQLMAERAALPLLRLNLRCRRAALTADFDPRPT